MENMNKVWKGGMGKLYIKIGKIKEETEQRFYHMDLHSQ